MKISPTKFQILKVLFALMVRHRRVLMRKVVWVVVKKQWKVLTCCLCVFVAFVALLVFFFVSIFT